MPSTSTESSIDEEGREAGPCEKTLVSKLPNSKRNFFVLIEMLELIAGKMRLEFIKFWNVLVYNSRMAHRVDWNVSRNYSSPYPFMRDEQNEQFQRTLKPDERTKFTEKPIKEWDLSTVIACYKSLYTFVPWQPSDRELKIYNACQELTIIRNRIFHPRKTEFVKKEYVELRTKIMNINNEYFHIPKVEFDKIDSLFQCVQKQR